MKISPETKRKALWASGIASGLIVVVVLSFVASWYSSSRKVAIAFMDALREHRMDEARSMMVPELEKRLGGDAATDGLVLLWNAKTVRYEGVVQIGFADPRFPYGCYDGEADGKKVWLIIRRTETWKVADVQTSQPKMCEGETP